MHTDIHKAAIQNIKNTSNFYNLLNSCTFTYIINQLITYLIAHEISQPSFSNLIMISFLILELDKKISSSRPKTDVSDFLRLIL